MLIQFNFENYKTYLNETNLDLTAVNIREHESNLISYKSDEKYLKVISIYGPNASGKSNILQAFNHMRYWVLKSFELSSNRKFIPQKRFKFNEKGKNGKSTFEVFFSYKENEYQYGFCSDDNIVYEEWLYKRNFKFKSKFDLVFEREKQNYNLRSDLNKSRELIKSINTRTLLISILASLNIEDVSNVVNWFDSTNVVNFGDVTFEFLISTTLPKVNLDSKIEKQKFIEFLSSIDIAIEDIRVEKIEEFEHSDTNEIFNKYKIFTLHRNFETGELEEIILSDESSGTVKMISLYYFLKTTLENGDVLFVDEMDAKLHPLLTRYIVNMFQNNKLNPNNAQLIFTTHDTNMLTRELFRRDQIWFTEKDKHGISKLFSLAEYKWNDKKIRNDATYNKDYLSGRYGAIPFSSLADLEDGNG